MQFQSQVLIARDMAVDDQTGLLGASAWIVVHGKSMLPSLWPGDLVWIDRVDPDVLSIGDVILFRLRSRYCMHRIEDIRRAQDGARIFVTRGDAMRQADPDVIEHQILGRVASVVRGQREISKVSERPLWNRGVGAALSRFEPMASLASRLIDEKMAWKKRRATGRPVTKQVNSRTKPQAETP